VAVEFGWNREQTLTQLARKAGLPDDAWKAKDARLMVFTTQERHFSTPFSAENE
jgi:AMMECR1 domain-containing protein